MLPDVKWQLCFLSQAISHLETAPSWQGKVKQKKSCWKLSAKFSFRAWHLFTTSLCSSSLTWSNSPWIYLWRVVSPALLHKHVLHTVCYFLNTVLCVIVMRLIVRSRTKTMNGLKYQEAIIVLKFRLSRWNWELPNLNVCLISAINTLYDLVQVI